MKFYIVYVTVVTLLAGIYFNPAALGHWKAKYESNYWNTLDQFMQPWDYEVEVQ